MSALVLSRSLVLFACLPRRIILPSNVDVEREDAVLDRDRDRDRRVVVVLLCLRRRLSLLRFLGWKQYESCWVGSGFV